MQWKWLFILFYKIPEFLYAVVQSEVPSQRWDQTQWTCPWNFILIWAIFHRTSVIRPSCPQSGAWRHLLPALGAYVGRVQLKELKQNLHAAGLLGGGWFGCGEWVAGETSETLTFTATWGTGHTWWATWLTNAQGLWVLFVCPHTWASRGVSPHPDHPQDHMASLPQEWAPWWSGPSVNTILWVLTSGSCPQLWVSHLYAHWILIKCVNLPAGKTQTQAYLVHLAPDSNKGSS